MATNVEIISKEMIKPSSSTPNHLKTLKLSFLDQIAPPVYIPLIFFYHHHQLPTNPHEISPSLKQSLSKILTIFYPLGGTFQENSSVDCNDLGAEFTEARVGARLSDVIQEANMEELNKLLPVESLGQDENIVLKARVNFLACGGVVIAVCLWHKVGDGTSLVTFVEAWAATCRGKTLVYNPSFDLASFFPPIPPSETLDSIQGAAITSERIVTKRVVFTKEKIEKLIKECSKGTGSHPPTRVEAVSSYIWRRFIEADKAKAGPQTTSLFAASHVVNLRPRKKRPPFSDNMFGNCWRSAIALTTPEDYGCSELAAKLRAAITSIDEGFIKKVENGEHLNDMQRSVDMFMKGGVEFCHFSSWCRFPVYEVDFGWGKPVWVGTRSVPFKNVAILMRTPCGEGIEALINLLEDDVEVFEQNQQIIG